MKALTIFLVVGCLALNSCRSQSIDKEIVLVNVGDYDKAKIAEEIEILNTLNPRVIAVDVALSEYTGSHTDNRLAKALRNCRELVMPSIVTDEGEDYQGKSMISVALASPLEFFPVKAKTGFVSAATSDGDVRVPRHFMLWQEDYSGEVHHHFSVITAMVFDSVKTVEFIERHSRLQEVDYRDGRIEFKKCSLKDLKSGRLTRKDIEGKIVMLGFLGPGTQDKFFTPLNRNPNEPDMYGVEYLAILVAQILR